MLYRTEFPEGDEQALNVRFMDIDAKVIHSWLVSVHSSAVDSRDQTGVPINSVPGNVGLASPDLRRRPRPVAR